MNKIIFPSFCVLLFQACSNEPSREVFPGPQGATTESGQVAGAQDLLGGFDATKTRLPGAPTQEQGQKAASWSLPFEAKLAEGARLPSQGFVFLALKHVEGGPPVGVRRVELAKVQFPWANELNQNDLMANPMAGMSGGITDGEYLFTVRVDQDGDPISRQNGDLFGEVRLKLPHQGAKLQLILR